MLYRRYCGCRAGLLRGRDVVTDNAAEAEFVNRHFEHERLDDREVIALGIMNATLALVEQQRIANVLTASGIVAAPGYGLSWLQDREPEIAKLFGASGPIEKPSDPS